MPWLIKHLVSLVIVLVTVSVPAIRRGADIDELKTAVEQLIGALNKKNLDAWSPSVHDQAVGFGLISPFPANSRAALREGFQGLFASMESFTLVPLNWQYRVVGASGYAWGHGMVRFKPKDGPTRMLWGREIMTWTRWEGSGRCSRSTHHRFL